MIKVSINLQMKISAELKKSTFDDLMSKVPSIEWQKFEKEYDGTAYEKHEFEYDSMAQMIADIDRDIKNFADDYVEDKFGFQMSIMDNYISLREYKFTVEKISGTSN